MCVCVTEVTSNVTFGAAVRIRCRNQPLFKCLRPYDTLCSQFRFSSLSSDAALPQKTKPSSSGHQRRMVKWTAQAMEKGPEVEHLLSMTLDMIDGDQTEADRMLKTNIKPEKVGGFVESRAMLERSHKLPESGQRSRRLKFKTFDMIKNGVLGQIQELEELQKSSKDYVIWSAPAGVLNSKLSHKKKTLNVKHMSKKKGGTEIIRAHDPGDSSSPQDPDRHARPPTSSVRSGAAKYTRLKSKNKLPVTMQIQKRSLSLASTSTFAKKHTQSVDVEQEANYNPVTTLTAKQKTIVEREETIAFRKSYSRVPSADLRLAREAQSASIRISLPDKVMAKLLEDCNRRLFELQSSSTAKVSLGDVPLGQLEPVLYIYGRSTPVAYAVYNLTEFIRDELLDESETAITLDLKLAYEVVGMLNERGIDEIAGIKLLVSQNLYPHSHFKSVTMTGQDPESFLRSTEALIRMCVELRTRTSEAQKSKRQPRIKSVKLGETDPAQLSPRISETITLVRPKTKAIFDRLGKFALSVYKESGVVIEVQSTGLQTRCALTGTKEQIALAKTLLKQRVQLIWAIEASRSILPSSVALTARSTKVEQS
ncbi:hypothetical protein V1512DRAFT_87817 [Lipomyces arxii]|uniref:uncharacterized protein n=1 Tax=Lipomyces arxii TaxID=56418 RepID=UPI0034CDFF6D